jgi:hypothetical protein
MKDFIKRLFSTAAIANIVLAIALVALTSWGIASVRKQFNDSVKNDFAAAALLAKIQLHGERMRRYEKESFIYLANPARRDKYVNEHADAYKKLLEDLDTALMPSGRAFTDEQRVVILKWKLASIFYVSEFKRLVDDARDLPAESANAGLLATEYNERIKAGKDRFAILLTGAGDMRLVKERASQEAAQTIDLMFTRLVWLVIGIVGAGGIGLQLLLGRRRPRDTRGHRKFADSRPDWTLAQ